MLFIFLVIYLIAFTFAEVFGLTNITVADWNTVNNMLYKHVKCYEIVNVLGKWDLSISFWDPKFMDFWLLDLKPLWFNFLSVKMIKIIPLQTSICKA